MQDLEGLGSGYKDEDIRLASLFFADDGMLLADSVGEAEQVIDRMRQIGNEYGLEMNMQKSKIIIFNMQEKPDIISNIKVVDKIKKIFGSQ